jgi:transcriptional regulator with XRE-family HTH domain
MPAHHTQFQLVQHLKHERVRQQLTQQDIADRVGVTRQAVSEWEQSDGDLHLSTVAVWAAALQLAVTLEPADGTPALYNSDGTAATPELTYHALITGPDRHTVAEALCAGRPTARVLSHGQPFGQPTPADNMIQHICNLTAALPGPADNNPGLLVVELTDETEPAVRVALERGRCIGWPVLVTAPNVDDVAPVFIQNVGICVHADSGVVVGRQLRRGRIEDVSWTV